MIEVTNAKDRGVCICDCEGNFLICDKKTEELLEISDNDVQYKTFFDILNPISLLYLVIF